jgi:superfamily II DNA or RNA helicase
MTALAAQTERDGLPEAGQLAQVRGQHWMVTGVATSRQPIDELAASRPPGRTLVRLSSVSDDDLGGELSVVWEVEPGREIVPATQLPKVTDTTWDDPQQLGAFLDAVRWGTVASADTKTLQAPFRSGISIDEYQLEPVARALGMPRVALLIADDVGLGKTIEAGLVMQEMLLRHRARRVVIVCPASLTLKWHEEMAARFGLDFQVLDTAALRELRRSHGLEANPFAVYPRIIISLQWLRTPRVQRLLDEVLTPQARYPGYFDLLVLDEAHHCAPPAPPKDRGYPVDSKQTQSVRRLGEYTQHRLFLSATPHNGYPGSWQALLAMLDPQRFTRGVEPDPAALRTVMIRRMKSDIRNPDGSERFPERQIRAVDIAYTNAEIEGYQLLQEYTASRRAAPTHAEARAGDLVTLFLKKRLFSSPAAFAITLGAHNGSENATNGRRDPRRADNDWLAETLEWDTEPPDDEPGSDDERAAFDRVAELRTAVSPMEAAYRRQLAEWAERHAAPADSKARALIKELDRICRPDGNWDGGDRVIVFTEYTATQNWLAGLLTARGLGGNRLQLLYGGLEERKRERIKAAFQASPERDPVRILLATDSASEGIDLQRHCHHVILYDIPFNPNRLEQRIGRVDRRGQAHQIEVIHFAGANWHDAAAGSYAGDLEYLSRVAQKVATERQDLGSVNPVLAHAVEARMLGRPVFTDPLAVKPTTTSSMLRAERDLREQIHRLRVQLDASVEHLHVAPPNIRRVVDTALAMAGQPPLADLPGPGKGLIAPPALKAGWERTVTGLADPLSGQPRPLTFDQVIADDRDDVVLAHLEHPLVSQSTRLLRSAIWGGRANLNRVAALRFTPPDEAAIDGPLIAVFARLVVVGADGGRLHEEVMLAARVVHPNGQSRRIELDQPRYAHLRKAVEDALEPRACRLAPAGVSEQVARGWAELEPLLAGDVQHRARQVRESLQRTLNRRCDEETRAVETVFIQLRRSLGAALDAPEYLQPTLDDYDEPERRQFERDRQAWQSRLDGLDDEQARELTAVENRYASVRELVFPFAVAVCVPDGERP